MRDRDRTRYNTEIQLWDIITIQSIWCKRHHSVSQTKLCPTILVDTTEIHAQLLHCTLKWHKSAVALRLMLGTKLHIKCWLKRSPFSALSKSTGLPVVDGGGGGSQRRMMGHNLGWLQDVHKVSVDNSLDYDKDLDFNFDDVDLNFL